MSSTNNNKIYYPFLLALYPIIALYTHNIKDVTLSTISIPLAIAIGAVLLLWICLSPWIKSNHKRGFAILIFLVFFYTYGYFQDSVNLILSGFDITKLNHFFLIPFFILLFVLSVFKIQKSKRSFIMLTKFLNFFSIILIALNIGIASHYGIGKLVKRVQHNTNIIVQKGKNHPTPDIYYIILDEFCSLSTIKNYFHYDHSNFGKTLKGLNFFIADQSKTRYSQTIPSIAATLNMTHLTTSDDEVLLFCNNQVVQFLKQKGYQIYHLTPNRTIIKLADHVFQYPKTKISFLLNPYYQLLLTNTMLRFVTEVILKQKQFIRFYQNRIHFLLNTLKSLPTRKTPKFIFAHILCPHDPYVFDSNGDPVDRKHIYNRTDKKYYLEQYIYISKKIIEVIKVIMSKSYTPPIIILQSDHGLRNIMVNGKIVKLGEEWKKIFNSYYLPGFDKNKLSPSISPVNSFRLIFNEYFKTELPFIKNNH